MRIDTVHGNKATPILQLIACLMKEERYQEAESIIKRYIDKDNEGDLRYYLGLVYTQQKRIEDALSEFRAVLSQNPENDGVKRLAIKLLVHQANRKIEEKDWDGACSDLSLALELKPNDLKIQQELIQFKNILPISYLKANRRKEAAEIWEEEQKKDPTNYRVTHSLALLYYWWAINEEKEIDTKKDTAFLDSLWLKAIANLVMLKNGDDFWKGWKEERERLCSRRGDIFQIEEEDIDKLRDKLPERLDKEFYNYADQYRQKGMEKEVERHERYQTALELELKSASYYKKIVELVKGRINEPIPPICGVMMLKHLGILSDVDRLVERASKIYPEDEKIEGLKIYLSPLGPIHILIEKNKLKGAIREIEMLPETIRSSKEGEKVHAMAYLKLGEEILTLSNDINEALNCWEKGLKYATDHSIANLLNKAVSDACIEQAKRLNNRMNFNEAIAILKRGERLVTDRSNRETLREHLAISYCDRGEKYLSEDNLSKAKKDLEKALEYNRNYRRAKDDLSVVYNNEGVKETNLDKAIKKLEKAYEYNPTDTVRKNLAGAYNAKAVEIAYWDRYSAAEYLMKALELDPYNDTIRKNLEAVLGYGGY